MKPIGGAEKVLIVGYGNDLRGDDCAGRRVADIIADRDGEERQVRSVQQLTPDLAPLIADADLAIFVDATTEALNGDVRVRHLLPATPSLDGGHNGSAPELLGLAWWLYGSSPEAYAVDIAADNFDFSLTPSVRTERAIATAIVCIDGLILGKRGDVQCMK